MEQELMHLSSQGLTRLKTGELEIFEEAINQPKIISASNEEIKQSLRYAMILVGVRANTINAMADEEKMILIEFMKNKFGYHTVSEIKLAFTKAAAHEFDIKEVAHYENFTCEYVGRIMSAYRKWATQMNGVLQSKLLQAEYDKHAKELPPVQYTEHEIVNMSFKNWTGFLKKNPEYANPNCYDILYRRKMLKLEEENINRIKNAAKNVVFGYKLNGREEMEYLKDKEKMNLLCRKIAVAEYFQMCYEQGVIQIDFPDPNREPDNF